MEAILSEVFGLTAESIQQLEGYDNRNFLIESNGIKYVLKDYRFDKNLEMYLQSESEFLDFLSDKGEFPKVISSLKGNSQEIINDRIYRLLTFIEGDLFASIKGDESYLESFGKKIAQLHKSSIDYYDPKLLARIDNRWDLKNLHLCEPFFEDCQDPKERKFLKYFYQQFEQNVLPKYADLRKSVIHGDINEHNVLVNSNEVKTFFDFGDVNYGPLVYDLAIALTYIALNYNDSIGAVTSVVRAYHSVYELEEKELDMLYYLIAARLVQSLSNAANSSKIQPENKEYITVNSASARFLIEEWTSINPIYFRNKMYEACGKQLLDLKSVNEEIDRRNKSISKALSVSNLAIKGAAFQYMYGENGKTYLDLRNNIPHVGHCHPDVVEANAKMQFKLNTNTRYVYPELADYAEQLLSKFPSNLNKVYFVNSGSAAGDLALRIAQTVTGRSGVGILEQGYHGNTYRMIEVSHYKYGSKGGFDQKKNVVKFPMPWNYEVVMGAKAKDQLIDLALTELNRNTEIGAFIAEPIVGCGGQLELPEGYLKHLYSEFKERNVLCISDEVQTGFARMGRAWWGYELYDVVPDIIVLGKCIGNGHPMAAVVTTSEISEKFTNGMEFFSSFGGNPVSCATGMAVLDVLDKEGLKDNALKIGEYLKAGLARIASKYKGVGVVRGSGFFLGVELVDENDSSLPNTSLCHKIKKELFDNQILVGSDGPEDNILKIKPPMCFTKANADQFLAAFETAVITES